MQGSVPAVSWPSAGPDVTVVVPGFEKKHCQGNGSFAKGKRQGRRGRRRFVVFQEKNNVSSA